MIFCCDADQNSHLPTGSFHASHVEGFSLHYFDTAVIAVDIGPSEEAAWKGGAGAGVLVEEGRNDIPKLKLGFARLRITNLRASQPPLDSQSATLGNAGCSGLPIYNSRDTAGVSERITCASPDSHGDHGDRVSCLCMESGNTLTHQTNYTRLQL